MKVLQVINHFLPKKAAGSEIYTWVLSKDLQRLGVDIKIITPNFQSTEENIYIYDELNVKQYPEPTVFSRKIAFGMKLPLGLIKFEELLSIEKPDIVHFQEVSRGCGITKNHVVAAKNAGAKVIMTFHLVNHTCIIGKLVQDKKSLCDGIIELKKCSICSLKDKGFGVFSEVFYKSSSTLNNLGFNPLNWNNRIGTILGTVNILDNHKSDLEIIVESCDKIVVITEWYKKMMINNGVPSKKIHFIPQALPNKKNHISHRKQSSQSPLKLVYFGRISPGKGLNLILESLKGFDCSKITLSIYGEAEDPKYGLLLLNQTKSMTNIHWMGSVHNNLVGEIMSNHDLLCVCSTFAEMSPLVIQEAFSVRLPVLASNIHGNTEHVIDGYNGLIFERDNVESLKQTIQRILFQPKLLAILTKNISPPHAFENISKEYIKIYNSMLNG